MPCILGAITGFALVAALWSSRPLNLLRSDSASYVAFDATRTVGYPAFIAAVRLLTGNPALAVPAQMLLLATALLTLGGSFYRYSRRPVATILFQVLLVSSIELWKLSTHVLTEALAAALTAFWCAGLLRAVREPSSRRVAGLVAIAAAGTAVRPSDVALFLGTGIFIVTLRSPGQRLRHLVLLVAAFLAAWGATPIARYFVTGSATSASPFARGILQHSLFCDPKRALVQPDAAFVEQSARPARRYIQAAPAGLKPALARTYSGQLRFGWIIPALAERHGFDAGWQTDPILSRVAWERVEANPLCYAQSVGAAYLRLATYGASGASSRLRTYLVGHPPVPVPFAPIPSADRSEAMSAAQQFHSPPVFVDPPPFKTSDRNPPLILAAARGLFGAAAIVGLLAVIALPVRRRRPEWSNSISLLAAAGAAFHGMIGITAIVELGLSRYCAPLWPVMCLILGTLICALSPERLRPGCNADLDPFSSRESAAL